MGTQHHLKNQNNHSGFQNGAAAGKMKRNETNAYHRAAPDNQTRHRQPDAVEYAAKERFANHPYRNESEVKLFMLRL